MHQKEKPNPEKTGHVKVMRARKGTGLGLFALRDIKTGEFIVEYSGIRIKTELADSLTTKYLFDMEDGWTVDGSPRTNTARYINHSCFPNAESDVENSHIYIHAIRDIMKGEEITMDYGQEYFDEFIKPHGCKCDACSKEEAPQKSVA